MTTKKLTQDEEKLLDVFSVPALVGLIGDANAGKSNFLYYLVDTLQREYDFNLYSYGLRVDLGEQKIYSVEELEVITDSIIIIDEFATLFDIDNRKEKRQIEQTLRLIFHNNNVVLLAGLPENYKKFIASKLNIMIFKRCALGDFVNGSRTKAIAIKYKGAELGAAVLNFPTNRCLLYDGTHYTKLNIPYMSKKDTKAANKPILSRKKRK